MPEVKSIPVACLYPHPDNPRKDLGDLTELADNIKANGIFQNLMVVPAMEVSSVWNELVRRDPPPDEAYVVIIGHRRLAAAKQAGLTEVPCVVTSLSPAEQIATMLEENMHRADLNVYEKTHGFQMMLDLGETVDSIVKNRGFSESTVRRHLKFTVFNDQTFKTATEKQITMDTLLEVAKIENAKKRDEVLASYGSGNFKWNLQEAVTRQEAKKRRPAAKKEILAYATEVEQIDYARCEHVMTVHFDTYTPGSATPKNGTDGEFVVGFSDKTAVVYKKKPKATAKKKSNAELEREADIRRRESELAELTASAYNLRQAFIVNLAVPKADYPKLMRHAVRALVSSNLNYWGSDFAQVFGKLLGAQVPSSYIPYELCKQFLEDADKLAPDKLVIVSIYAAYRDKSTCGYWQKTWQGMPCHFENHALDYLYEFLCDFGYEISDVEKALKDGMHPLLLTEEKAAALNVSDIESGA